MPEPRPFGRRARRHREDAVLAVLRSEPDRSWYVFDLWQRTRESDSSVYVALATLEHRGLIVSSWEYDPDRYVIRPPLRLYKINPDHARAPETETTDAG